MAAAPAIVRFVGGTPGRRDRVHPADGADHAGPNSAVRRCRRSGFVGTPTGIDARRVVETGIAPVINTGHRPPGRRRRPDRGRDRPRAARLLRGARSGARGASSASRTGREPRHDRATAGAVVAIGGNALILDGQRARSPSSTRTRSRWPATSRRSSPTGWGIVLTHGNGPQVGFILLRSELVGDTAPVPRLSLEMSSADSQGGIGHILGDGAAQRAGAPAACRDRVAYVLTHTVVDPADPAFADPTKPIGPFYDADQADDEGADATAGG